MRIDEDNFEQFFDGLAVDLVVTGHLALQRITRATKQLAYENSSGPLSPSDLRKQDHPYAVRHGSPKQNPGVINVGKGRDGDHFRDHWKIAGPSALVNPDSEPVSDGGLTGQELEDGYTVYNDSPIAEKFLQPGTAKMFARPVDKETLKDAEPMADRILKNVFDQFARGSK